MPRYFVRQVERNVLELHPGTPRPLPFHQRRWVRAIAWTVMFAALIGEGWYLMLVWK